METVKDEMIQDWTEPADFELSGMTKDGDTFSSELVSVEVKENPNK